MPPNPSIRLKPRKMLLGDTISIIFISRCGPNRTGLADLERNKAVAR
jgi:hypothetical protein